jgi:hypothetical protein
MASTLDSTKEQFSLDTNWGTVWTHSSNGAWGPTWFLNSASSAGNAYLKVTGGPRTGRIQVVPAGVMIAMCLDGTLEKLEASAVSTATLFFGTQADGLRTRVSTSNTDEKRP